MGFIKKFLRNCMHGAKCRQRRFEANRNANCFRFSIEHCGHETSAERIASARRAAHIALNCRGRIVSKLQLPVATDVAQMACEKPTLSIVHGSLHENSMTADSDDNVVDGITKRPAQLGYFIDV
jgi:hypothetical protein